MKLATLAASVALAMAMTLGGGAIPTADAGQKGSKKKVHVRLNNNLSDTQALKLEKAAKKLKGPHRDALLSEIEKRRATHNANKNAEALGRMLSKGDAVEQILGLGILGSQLSRKRGGH